ncbi:WG repeat-containing protein [Flexibacter flexilis]|uniref:WG repeat-containing protein n=1 Tax=Flexibacter flexilis TaxID=998 RepID=UPI00373FCD81
MDKQGTEVIPLIYDYAENFSEGLACVNKNGKVGFINTEGKEVIPFVYDDYESGFNGGLVKVKQNGKWFYINKQGNFVKNYQ